MPSGPPCEPYRVWLLNPGLSLPLHTLNMRDSSFLLCSPRGARRCSGGPSGLASASLPTREGSAPRRPWGRRVVRQEEALRGTAPHGTVRVQQQPREAVGEVPDKAVRDRAQRLPDLFRELPVVVLLVPHSTEQVSHRCPLVRPEPSQICLQRHRDVLVPVTPDHLGASRLERCHQGPLLRLLLQPVADILGPTELPSLLTGTGGHRPGGSNGWGRGAASTARLRVKDCCLLLGGASLLCRG